VLAEDGEVHRQVCVSRTAAAVDDPPAADVQLERRRLDRRERALAHDVELDPWVRARDLGDRVLLEW
jgi:hypothetical protein